MFPVLFIPPEASDSLEPLGTKPKFWFKGEHNIDCLFKETTLNTGEDWAEKIVSELCWFLGLPHVDYTLAEWQGKRGVVCGNFVPEGGRLVLGNELLARINPKYPDQKRFGVRQYTLRRVLAIFRTRETQIKAPLNWTSFAGVTTALDVFIGYLLLDAWIANQDRHHENWGLIVTPALTQHLAPSYDHASSLGRNETEHNRTDRLTTHDRGRSMDRYVARAKSAFFASPARKQLLSTVEAFHEAGKVRPRAANAWLQRLAAVSAYDVQQLFAKIPNDRITPVAVEFALKMLALNRQRLLALHEALQ